MRVLSLDVVETIETWRKHGREGAMWPDPHTGDNYLLKMKDDTRWLADSPLGDILRFSPKSDPFFVVPSTNDSTQPPTNQMTPTLQAQRRQSHGVAGDQRRAVLPLQNSLLRRIRAAELYILKECVQARMQMAGFSVPPAGGDGFVPGRAVPPPSADLAAAAATYGIYGQLPAARQAPSALQPPGYGQRQLPGPPQQPLPLRQPQQPQQTQPQQQPQQPLLLPPQHTLPPVHAGTAATAVAGQPHQMSTTLSPLSPVAVADAAAAEDASFAAPPKSRPPPPQAPEGGAVALVPLAATKATVGALFQQFGARVDAKLFKSTEQWDALKGALEDDGLGAPEFFWLVHRDRPGGVQNAAPSAEDADGLAVYRLKRASTTFGQLLHFSVVDAAWVEDGLAAVKARMFALLPIKSIRITLWYNDATGEMQLNKDFETSFKTGRFRWFQLCNSKGVRGQVMNCPRAEPPDDPPMPPEDCGIEVCVGQVWMRGCTGTNGVSSTRRRGSCASNLVLASACLKQFWERDAVAVAAAKDASGETREIAAASAAARDGLVRGLLSGELDKLLKHFSPVQPPADEQDAGCGGGSSSSTALARGLAKALDAGGKKCRAVPGALVEPSSSAHEGAQLVQRGVTAPGFVDSTVGLASEALASSVEALAPADLVLGRSVMALDWLGVVSLPGGGFEVPVQAAGLCQRHPHPVLYMGTSEDDVFVVVIPWSGVPVPAEEGVFAACTDVLRNTTPIEKPPVQVLRFDGTFDVRRKARTFEVPEPFEQLGLPAVPASQSLASVPRPGVGDALHVAEFSSLSVAPGRIAAGRLPAGAETVPTALAVQRPFAFCLFHTDIDDLNAPLSATLVS